MANLESAAASRSASTVGASGSNGNHTIEEAELNSALQLLVERAQYITGATGTALALPQGEEMVCRASAGSSAPAVGARLQVRSGLTGESISRRQLLRCDNAEADPRVNLETCRALGIASIVVLPLLRRDGEVRGLFELFSDHPYAFEERDLIALERMADLTMTALDLAEQRHNSLPAPSSRRDPEKAIETTTVRDAQPASIVPIQVPPNNPSFPGFAEPALLPAETPVLSPSLALASESATVPEAMLRVQKCDSCGFPISEGRTLCLDCEKKNLETKIEKRKIEQDKVKPREQEQQQVEQETSGVVASSPDEFVPAFLANSVPVKESWMANHVNLLAIVVLILGVLVAVVVFR